MAQKEIAIKIKIYGQEIDASSKDLEAFKKVIDQAKLALDGMGARVESNAAAFDSLKGDIEQMDVAFGEATKQVNDNTDGLKTNETQTENSDKATKSYTAQIKDLQKQLIGLGDRTSENGVQYDALQSKIKNLREKQEDLQFGTKKLDDSLSGLPGPIGKIGTGMKQMTEMSNNAKAALKTLGLGFDTFNKALLTSGVGALVIIFGLLIAAVINAFKTFKPLQTAMENLKIALEPVMEIVQGFIELVGKGLAAAMGFLGKAVAWLTGTMDSYNAKLKEASDAKAFIKASEERKKALEDERITVGEERQKQIDNEIKMIDDQTKAWDEYYKAKEELNAGDVAGEAKLAKERDRLLSNASKQRLVDDIKSNDEYAKAQADKAKAEADKAKQKADELAAIEKDYIKRLETIDNEGAILKISRAGLVGRELLDQQREISLLTLEQAKKTQLEDIALLKVTSEKKQKLINDTNETFLLKEKAIQDAYNATVLKANEDLIKQTRDAKYAAIKDDRERAQAQLIATNEDALKAVDDTVASEEAKNEAKKAINEKYVRESAKIDEDAAKLHNENVFKQIEFERASRTLALENKLKEIDLSYQSEQAKILARQEVFKSQAEIDRLGEIDNLKKLLDAKEITQAEYDSRKIENDKKTQLSLKENSLQTEKDLTAARQANADAVMALSSSIGQLATSMGEETEAGKILIKVQQAMALASTIMGIANAFAGLGQDLSKGFPTNIIAVASTLALIATAIIEFKSLTGIGVKAMSSGSSGTSTSTNNLGKNYGNGGYIQGNSHSSGGVPIMAEGGEVIMNKRSVSMFRPMLSMMNQVGGGTSFNHTAIAGYDSPTVKNPSEDQSPIIIKTYVVSNDMTSEQEKQAKLKALSTI